MTDTSGYAEAGETITIPLADYLALRAALQPFAALADQVEAFSKSVHVHPDSLAKVWAWADLERARAVYRGGKP